MSKKIIAFSQNIKINQYQEIEDCLNIRWTEFIDKLNFLPLQIPTMCNNNVEQYFKNINIQGVILTGGNDVYYKSSKNNNSNSLSKKRNNLERKILEICIKNEVPVLGVCRGMQFINVFFGGKLSKLECHSAKEKHKIINCEKKTYKFPQKVNTFHNYGIPQGSNSKLIKILAIDEDKNIEAFSYDEKKILGIMWHPERDKPFNKIDLNLVKRFFSD